MAMTFMVINVVLICIPLTFMYWFNLLDYPNFSPAWVSVGMVTVGFAMTNKIAFMGYKLNEVKQLGIITAIVSLIALILAITGAF